MCRPKKRGSKLEAGAWNTIGVQSIPLTEMRQSIKYSKNDRVCQSLCSFRHLCFQSAEVEVHAFQKQQKELVHS